MIRSPAPGPVDLTGAAPRLPDAARAAVRAAWCDAAAAADPLAQFPLEGLPSLRSELAHVLACRPEDVVVTGGVRSAISALGGLLARTVVERPGFTGIRYVLQACGYQVLQANQGQPAPDNAALWITHPCRNPDGRSLTSSELEKLVAMPWKLIVINEAYRWYRKDKFPAAPDDPRVVHVGSLSKVLGPGARIGWIRGEAARFLEGHAQRAAAPGPVSQNAWALFLRRQGIRLAEPMIDEVLLARQLFCSAAGDAVIESCAGSGPTLLATVGPRWGGAEGVFRLTERGVSVGAGPEFDASEMQVRLAFTGVIPENAYLAGLRFAAAVGTDADHEDRRRTQLEMVSSSPDEGWGR
jgi:DNA-binding transcriptional MocR family regulator